MESDTPNKTTNQPPVRHIPEAAVLTGAGPGITTCHAAASALFLYNQQDAPGHRIPFPASTSSVTNSLLIMDTAFAFDAANGGHLFIYKPLDADQKHAVDGVGFDMQTLGHKKTKIKNGSTKQPIIRL